MKTKDIIGRKISDILVCSKIEVGGLDSAEVFIKLESNDIIGIPWGLDSENIEKIIDKDALSLFSKLNDSIFYHINPEKKTIEEILQAKKYRESTFIGRIKKLIGIGEKIPREYKVFKTEYRENKLKYIKNQVISDFIMFDNSDSSGFIELGNGFIITETIMSPHGTGKAGLNYYESLNEFEARYGKDYVRLKTHINNEV